MYLLYEQRIKLNLIKILLCQS